MVGIDVKIKNTLEKIEFVKRYEELSCKYNNERTPDSKRLEYVDGEEVMEMICDLGYLPLFNKKEKFYKIKEQQEGAYTFGVHIILKYGTVELVWVVRENGKLLLGEPWATYSRELIDLDYRIKKPVFGTYEDLEEIFQITFQMYEDFKKALIEKRD